MSKLAIICVDDDEFVLNSLGEQLSRSFGQDYVIEMASSGEEALELLSELETDGVEIPLIISDQIMPKMKGDQLLTQIHTLYPKPLKIMLTGQVDTEAIVNTVNAAKLYRYITKPWDETDLILTVKEALRRYTQEQQLAEQNQALWLVNEELEKSLALLKATFESTADGILAIDRNGKVGNFNHKFVEIWNIPDSVVALKNGDRVLEFALDQLTNPDSFLSKIREMDTQSTPASYELLELKNNKTIECYSQPQWFEGKSVGKVWSFRDITERKQAEEYVRHQARHDFLTGLSNRVQFNERLAEVLANSPQTENMLAVLFIDLDRFKLVNDTLGHTIGDLLLQVVVERLTGCLRAGDLIARWGGDEFTLLLPKISCADDASTIAQRILKSLNPGFNIEGHHIHITGSIGIAVYPQDGEDAETLIKNADAALYRAKKGGRNDFQRYMVTINSQACELLALESSLHRALERQELIVYYQPQVNTATGEITQMEALVRWQHPELGLLAPRVFIPLAEENGLILHIGEWVLQTACAQNKAWQAMGRSNLCVGVNLAARQLQQPTLPEKVTDVLVQTGLEARFLELELTETAALQNVELTKESLTELHQMGVQIALDDFGTGYSSLSYLRQFPFNTLKIDQSFIRDLLTNPKDAEIVTAIVALGQGLKLKVVAEGVETESLKDQLINMKCELMQGYFFARPLPPEDATRLLMQQNLMQK
jgi:diguanylate cyclase (GGDEF)-like protein